MRIINNVRVAWTGKPDVRKYFFRTRNGHGWFCVVSTNKDKQCKGCCFDNHQDCGMCCGCSAEAEISKRQCVRVNPDDYVITDAPVGEKKVYQLKLKPGSCPSYDDVECVPAVLPRQLHKVANGIYFYGEYQIANLGYYEPDHHEVWEASYIDQDKFGYEGVAHGFTLGSCLQELKWAICNNEKFRAEHPKKEQSLNHENL